MTFEVAPYVPIDEQFAEAGTDAVVALDRAVQPGPTGAMDLAKALAPMGIGAAAPMVLEAFMMAVNQLPKMQRNFLLNAAYVAAGQAIRSSVREAFDKPKESSVKHGFGGYGRPGSGSRWRRKRYKKRRFRKPWRKWYKKKRYYNK